MGSGNFGGLHSHTVTIQVKNRDTFAEIALVVVGGDGEKFGTSGCAIAQIVSDSGVENFRGLERPFAFRRNVTSVTFATAGYKSASTARWALNFWS